MIQINIIILKIVFDFVLIITIITWNWCW